MPKLNPDILYEIFIKSAIEADDAECLTKLMFSGKETFKIGLKCFDCVENVRVDKFTVDILLQEKGYFNFSFDNPLLKVLIPISAASTCEELFIAGLPKNKYVKIFGLETLFEGNFKKLYVAQSEKFFSKKAKRMLMNNENIQMVVYDGHKSFKEIPAIPQGCRKLIYNKLDFNNFLKEKPYYLSFLNVEEIIIDQENDEFEDNRNEPYEDIKGINFHFNAPTMLHFSSFIATHIPKLKFLHIDLTYDTIQWSDNMITNIFGINSNIFQKIPKYVKGSIEFFVYVKYTENDKIVADFLESARADESIQVELGRDTSSIKKEFEIHEGLSFKFGAELYCESV